MNADNIITTLYERMNRRPEVRSLIPMGYVPNLPLLAVRAEQLVAIVPFLRYKVTGVIDHTKVFPVRYVLEYALPEQAVVGFRDLAATDRFVNTDFDKAVGFFRHPAINMLSAEAYRQLRRDTLALYDKLCASLIDDAPFTSEDDITLRNNLRALVEPSVKEFYEALDTDFYDKYIKD